MEHVLTNHSQELTARSAEPRPPVLASVMSEKEGASSDQTTDGSRTRLPVGLWLGILALMGICGALLYWFPPEQYALYPHCLFYSWTGWQCPGCGGLRAAHQLLHGHIAAALHLNPLLFVLLALAGIYTGGRLLSLLTHRDWLRWLRHPFWLWLLLGFTLVFTLVRNLPPGFWNRF